MTKIYHNPRCSKSRATLALLIEKGVEPEVCLYLDNPPNYSALTEITTALGCSIKDVMRKGESRYKELSEQIADLDENGLIRLVIENPILLERPIVTNYGKAAIGRPPENVIDIL